MCKFLSLMLLCNISMSFFDVSKLSVTSGVHMLTFYVVFFFPSGGKLVYLYTKKPGSVPKCGDCKVKLHGVCFI